MAITYVRMFYPYTRMNILDVLFPKVRGEILRLLFADPSKEYHLRELARLSCLAVGTLQTELEKQSQIQLLLARRDGNRLYYRANSKHLLFPELQGIALKTTGLREQVLKALSDLKGVQLAFVFGSQAAGTADSTSDVDLMVIGSLGLRVLAPRLRPLSEALGREINPQILSKESFTTKARAADAFIKNVLAAPKLWIIGSDDELGSLV
jgi:predicted nucleotidyltransferase